MWTDSKVAGLPVYEPKHITMPPTIMGCYGGIMPTALKYVPRDTFWAWGLYDSLIVVIPSLDIIVLLDWKIRNAKRVQDTTTS